MATEAQMRANQENAQKSRGPTSVEGKKRSSLIEFWFKIFRRQASTISHSLDF